MRPIHGYLWAVTGASVCPFLLNGFLLAYQNIRFPGPHGPFDFGILYNNLLGVALLWVAAFLFAGLPFWGAIAIARTKKITSPLYFIACALFVSELLGPLILGGGLNALFGEGTPDNIFDSYRALWLWFLPSGLVGGLVYWLSAVRNSHEQIVAS